MIEADWRVNKTGFKEGSMRPFLLVAVLLGLLTSACYAQSERFEWEWPNTDFTQASVPLEEIRSGGPPRDGIPSIDEPRFAPLDEVELDPLEPVIGLVVGEDARAYPLRILMWHEIVNDVVAETPVAVTYCPLCNTAIVFDRRLDDRVLDFGTTGKLRNSDLVMYDRQTESWWQQFVGKAIVGELIGAELRMIPARLESFQAFRERAPDGEVLIPSGFQRAYGSNPYQGYDTAPHPFLYQGELPEGIDPMARVVRVGDRAWALSLVRDKGSLEEGDLRIQWAPGQRSALDHANIAQGRDVGGVVVQQNTDEGWIDVPYSVDFAFAFHAFYPDAPIHGAGA